MIKTSRRLTTCDNCSTPTPTLVPVTWTSATRRAELMVCEQCIAEHQQVSPPQRSTAQNNLS